MFLSLSLFFVQSVVGLLWSFSLFSPFSLFGAWLGRWRVFLHPSIFFFFGFGFVHTRYSFFSSKPILAIPCDFRSLSLLFTTVHDHPYRTIQSPFFIGTLHSTDNQQNVKEEAICTKQNWFFLFPFFFSFLTCSRPFFLFQDCQAPRKLDGLITHLLKDCDIPKFVLRDGLG